MSFYHCSPSTFFSPNNRLEFPVAANFNEFRFNNVLKGLSGRSSRPGATWGEVFGEDDLMRSMERQVGEISSKIGFVHGATILSIDDDQFRLSSRLVSDVLGLDRVRNPKKAFGPVSTGAVSITTSLTLATRLSGRGETNLESLQVLLQ